MAYHQSLIVLLAAGSAAAGPQVQPELAPGGTMQSEPVAHIYYNIATGEKVATLLSGVRPADNGASPAVWIADNTAPCADFGITSATVGLMEDPDCTTCFSTGTGWTYLDWGDAPTDTVVDCVGITWSSQVPDVDTDGDGVGDGVEGFGATWSWYDAENGFNSTATRLDITGFTFVNLPGDISGLADSDLFATYYATVDLAASFSSSLAFEIGDTDSIDDSGTGQFNPGAGADLDTDGLADFGYSLRYFLPGRFDLDNADGDDNPYTGVDGDPNAAADSGWLLVTGNGDVSSDGTTYTPETDVPGAQGIEDAFDIYIDFNNDSVLEPLGTFWYGGFVCNDVDDPDGDLFDPYAQFYMQLYGPGPGEPCPADLFPAGGDGLLNFFDVNVFITAFVSGDLGVVDFYPPGGGDGLINLFDISAYLALFNAGCP